MSISKLRFSIHDPSQTKITDLNVAIDIKKYISRFEVSMKYNLATLSTPTALLNFIIAVPPVTMIQA
jgi:hypothetical protein